MVHQVSRWSAELETEVRPWSHDPRWQAAVLALVPATYAAGLLCLALYYCTLHPGGRMPNPTQAPRIL